MRQTPHHIYPVGEGACRDAPRGGYRGGEESEVELSLIRLEAAIWSLMVNKEEEEILEPTTELESFGLVPSNVGNSPKRPPSVQKTAKNLWQAKRQGWEDRKNEEDYFLSFQNRPFAITRNKENLCNKENKAKENSNKDDTKQVNGLGSCLEEFNFLYNCVEASLEEFWNR